MPKKPVGRPRLEDSEQTTPELVKLTGQTTYGSPPAPVPESIVLADGRNFDTRSLLQQAKSSKHTLIKRRNGYKSAEQRREEDRARRQQLYTKKIAKIRSQMPVAPATAIKTPTATGEIIDYQFNQKT